MGQDATALEITGLLNGVSEVATDRLFQLLYVELKAMARSRMARERPNNTLTPTALVHDAYLRLVRCNLEWANRRHFFAAAAEAMRRILVESARRKKTARRGSGVAPQPLTDVPDLTQVQGESMADLDRALTKLEAIDEQMAEVVKLRYFAGLTVDDTAATLAISARSVNRAWTAARAWLTRELAR